MKKYIKTFFDSYWPLVTATLTLIAVFVFCMVISIPRVVNILQERSAEALTNLGTTFAKVEVSFSGRDATLKGKVTGEELKQLAHRLVEEISGVRVVKNELQVLETCSLFAKNSQNLQAELATLAINHSQVGFHAGATAPSKELMNYLQDVARIIKRYELISVTIVAYADPNTSSDYNFTLSEDRAQAVRKALIEEGVSARCLSARVEEKEQLLTNQTSEGQNYIKFLVEELE